MNKKRFLLPIIGMVGALLVALTITFPILSMEPKDIPVGIISVDEGMNTPNGEVNIGNTILSKFIKSDNKLIYFKEGKSEKELNNDLAKGKYYATIVIPNDFSKNSVSGEAKLKVVINEGINPMVSSTLTPILQAMSQKSGVDFEITSINSVASLGIKAMLLPMMFIMLTFITSVVTSLLITLNIKQEDKIKNYFIQLLYIVTMAFVIGFIVSTLAILIAGVDISITKVAFYLTTVSFAIMLLANGAINLLGKKGIVIPVLLFILGIGCMQLPYEYLNGIYQNLIASWEPFRYIGIGIREILYQNKGVINTATTSLVILALLGIILSIMNILKKEKSTNKTEEVA